MPKIMHGSVSLPSVEQLASQYVIAMVQNDLFETWQLMNELTRRTGYDRTCKLIEEAKQTYLILKG